MKIRRLPSGNYNAVLYIGKDANGKQIRKSFTAPDRQTVRKMVAEYEAASEESEDAPTLLDAISDYINAKKADLSPYSIRGYKNIETGGS